MFFFLDCPVSLGPPEAKAQRSCSGSTIDSISIIVGIIIGTIATLGIIAIIWLLKTKREKGESKLKLFYTLSLW